MPAHTTEQRDEPAVNEVGMATAKDNCEGRAAESVMEALVDVVEREGVEGRGERGGWEEGERGG